MMECPVCHNEMNKYDECVTPGCSNFPFWSPEKDKKRQEEEKGGKGDGIP
jgi:hypothetical protein